MRNKRKIKNRENFGFSKPVAISKELAKFMNVNPDEKKSRVFVTRFICNYVKTHGLQKNNENKRLITPDKPLKKLLKYDAKKAPKPLDFSVMQTYLKHHFI